MALFGGDSSLQIVIKAKDEASKVFDGLAKKHSQTVKNLGKIGVAAAGVGVVLGKQAVDAAMSFEKSMSNVSTLLDTTTEDMEKMKKEVLSMSTRVPVALEDLTGALYDVRSAGIDAGSAMEVLENAAELGVAGLGTTKESADLLTTAINAFGLQGRESSEVADVLFKTVKAGKTNIANLSQAFGKMAGNAKAAGISFEDTQAATAALTALTGKTSEAQNALAQVFLELTVQGGKLDKGLEENGTSLTALNNIIGERGLVGGMSIMRNAMGLTDTEFKNLFSSAEGGTAVYQLLTDAYDANSNALNSMTNEGNMLDEAVRKQNETYEAQYIMLKNKINEQLIYLGVKILPLIKTGIEKGIIIIKEWKSWFDSLADALGTFIFNVKKGWDWLVKIDNKLRDSKIANFLTGGSGGIPFVPFFQHGGIVPGNPTQAVPIMAHGGEQVIPAGKSGGTGGGSMTVNINNPSIRSDDDIRKIKMVIEDVFRDVFLNNKVAI